ncbi:MAG: endonuclease domain-containing protein, partial [Dongiaceae bacterium]
MRAPILTFKRAKALRRAMTAPEVLLWQGLRSNRLNGLRFRRQRPIGPYILDFFCASTGLAVEIDGAGHDHPDSARRDARRDAWLRDRGVRVLRIKAQDVLQRDRIGELLLAIEQAAGRA